MGLYIDIAIVVLALVVLLIWTNRGFAASMCLWLRKFGCFAVAIVATIYLTPVLSTKLEAIGDKFVALVAPLLGKIPGAGTEVASLEELTELMSSGALKLLSTQAENIWKSMESLELYTIAGVYGNQLFGYIVYGGTFLVTFLLAIYLVRLMRITFKAVNKIEFFRLFDKILGCIFSIVATYIIVVVLLSTAEIVVAKWLPKYLELVMKTIYSSKILSLVHSTNVIGALLASLLKVTLPSIG